MDDLRGNFPLGMRVLAADNDQTCLKMLEILLQRCQYHVTTAENATMTLKLLRENKNKFDLVISDVHMPDMDGFKLLELVRLEMDLPVILLSASDDPKIVMKGISHGACYHLLKPVRIEELQNIWQHVIRRKKITKSNNQDTPNFDHNRLDSSVSANSNKNEKPFTKKRKNRNEDDVKGHQENGVPIGHKKPRVAWTADLHYKFVAAVNQLGIDNAVPRKIVDLMNVEKLTRENVASHLQKYRQHLKKQTGKFHSQFFPSRNDISSITPLSSQPHDSWIDINSQTACLIPVSGVEPKESLDFSFCDEIVNLTEETSFKPHHHQEYVMNQLESQNSGISDDFDPLEAIVSAMIKENQENVELLDEYLL